jgi:hypothetical protein
MMPPEIQARIDQIYADIKPLQDYYGITSQTIDSFLRAELVGFR